MKSEDVIDDAEDLCYCFAGSTKLEGLHHARLRDVDNVVINQGVSFYETFIEYFFGLNSKYSLRRSLVSTRSEVSLNISVSYWSMRMRI